jgi:hypothetical protein
LHTDRSLTEWDSGSDDDANPTLSSSSTAPANPNARLVILRRMFTLAELEEDATLLLDLKEEVREEAETMGEVTNVQVWDVRRPFFACLFFRAEADPSLDPFYPALCFGRRRKRAS